MCKGLPNDRGKAGLQVRIDLVSAYRSDCVDRTELALKFRELSRGLGSALQLISA